MGTEISHRWHLFSRNPQSRPLVKIQSFQLLRFAKWLCLKIRSKFWRSNCRNLMGNWMLWGGTQLKVRKEVLNVRLRNKIWWARPVVKITIILTQWIKFLRQKLVVNQGEIHDRQAVKVPGKLQNLTRDLKSQQKVEPISREEFEIKVQSRQQSANTSLKDRRLVALSFQARTWISSF